MKSIIVDNFFEEPLKVVDFAKTLEYNPRTQEQYWEGIRTQDLSTIDNDFYRYVCEKIVYSYYNQLFQYKIDATCYFHKLSERDYEDPQWINDKVHKDETVTSSIVYLTPNAPMTSGTQIYRKISDQYIPDLIFHNKFNRMVMFPGPLPHSAMDLIGGDEERLTMLFFIHKIKQLENR